MELVWFHLEPRRDEREIGPVSKKKRKKKNIYKISLQISKVMCRKMSGCKSPVLTQLGTPQTKCVKFAKIGVA